MLLACRSEQFLNSVEEYAEELLGVLLEGGVSWVSIHVFEGEAELSWVVCLSFRQLQEPEQFLQLPEHAVVYHVALVLHYVLGSHIYCAQ